MRVLLVKIKISVNSEETNTFYYRKCFKTAWKMASIEIAMVFRNLRPVLVCLLRFYLYFILVLSKFYKDKNEKNLDKVILCKYLDKITLSSENKRPINER